MHIGISTPGVIVLPGVAAAWESEITPDQLGEIAGTADALGFAHLTCSEHVAVPGGDPHRGVTYYDPLATLSFLAALTRQISLVTSVLVLPYHQPLALAKQYGTLDRLSGGRLVLGIGVGALEEEFAALGAPWADRGALTDQRLGELRELWGRREVDGLIVDPTSPRPTVPIWIGGRTRRSLRRAIRYGSGWMPFGLSAAEIAGLLATESAPPDLEVVLATGRPLDPEGDPDRVHAVLDRLAEAGATRVTCGLTSRSATHYREQLQALADLIGAHR